jgi:hypothetical protein
MNETAHRNMIPCEICKCPTATTTTKRCDNCWEVEKRLPAFLGCSGGQTVVRQMLPLLDDWDVWDYEAVLRENDVSIEWCHQITSDGVTYTEAPPDLCGWGFSWKHGCIHIGHNTETIARKAAALFVSLWLRGFSASFADKLMDEYIVYLQRQENKSLTFLAKVLPRDLSSEWCYFQLTREGVCEKAPINYVLEEKIIDALGKPNNNEEIIVTFAKRKKHG